MKQLVILSGKGGTGKTSIAASFAHLSSQDPKTTTPLFVDADVDAANLSILIDAKNSKSNAFYGSKLASIDQQKCSSCGTCQTLCRFNAIQRSINSYTIDPFACEGCRVCADHCPEQAISMNESLAGHWFRSQSKFGTFYHAELLPGQENSGKLISLIKETAKAEAIDQDHNLIIIDGPPGIGCPVISSITGVNIALIIAEPSVSGIHDMERIIETANHFGIPTYVCINKADLNPSKTNEIEEYCNNKKIQILGKIPFDKTITEAMKNNQTITEVAYNSETSIQIKIIWKKISKLLRK